MHIIHVFPSRSWGGAEIYSLELAERQLRNGWFVSFWGTKNSRLIQEAHKRQIPVITEELPLRLNLLRLPKLLKVIRRSGATHLHLHWSGGPWAFLGVKLFARVKLIYHNHMWIKHYKADPFHWFVYKFVDYMIVAGERARDSAQKFLSISPKKLQILPYGIDLQRIGNLNSSRQEFGIPEDAFVFGMFSRIDRQKGTKEFLTALENCMNEPKVYGVLVGDPTLHEDDAKKYQAEIEMQLSHEPLKSRVHRSPSRSDYLRLLKQCDVLVVPSYHESYSLLILDAFMLGLPVISTLSGGTPDLVSAERGWLVNPQNVDELRAAMMNAVKNSNEARGKGESARLYVMQNHSFDSVLDKSKFIYQ